MKNAMTWAIGVDAAAQLSALAIAPLQYTDGPVPVPNYERRNPAPRLQQPLSTGEAAKHMQIPPGFELQLFAAEPLISGNPEAMAWDERGRLWIAETRDYPNNPQPAGAGERRHQDPGRHEPRRPGRQGHCLRRQPDNRQQPRLCQRRHHRLAGWRDGRPERHERRRQGRSARVADPRLEHPRHPRAGVEPEVRAGQLDLGRGRLLRLQRHRRRAGPELQPGPLSLLARRQPDGAHGELHEQHVGARLQRDVRRVRLDRERRAQRLRGDPAPVLPGRLRPDRRRQEEDRRPLRDAGEHAESPAGGRAGRVHRRGGAQLLHGARVPRGILEPHRLRERAYRPCRPSGDRRASGLGLRREGRLERRRQR